MAAANHRAGRRRRRERRAIERRGWSRFLRLTALGLAVVAALAHAPALAQAPREQPQLAPRKIVGLVFDDSGSMKYRIQLPAFAAQLLVSSLDPTRDRLFTALLSAYEATAREPAVAQMIAAEGGVTPQSMARLRAMRLPELPRDEFAQGGKPAEIVNRIRTRWPVPRANTPYGAVELMLATLVAEAGPGEEAHLVVLTDGAFDPPPPLLTTVARNLAAYRAGARTPVFVHFVLIDAEGSGVAGKVDEQGVRRALTATFNGEPDKPLYNVSTSSTLKSKMFDVIAAINATDRSGRPEAGGIVNVQQQRLLVRSPLSVARIVGVTFAPAGQEPAQVLTTSFGARPTLEVLSSMDAADTAAGWRDEKLRARAAQFNFANALDPGEHALDFDRPIGPDHLFLFDTLARFEIEVRDASGAPLPRGRDGVPEAVNGQSLALIAALKDRVGGRDVPVDPATTPNSSVAAWVAGPRGRVAMTPQVEPGAARYVARFEAAPVGAFEAGGVISIEGFVRKEARRPAFRVVDGAVRAEMSLRAADCPQCAAGELRTQLRPGEPTRVIGEIAVKLPPDRPAPFTLRLEGAPQWLKIVDVDGRDIAPDRPLTVGQDGRFSARLARHIERPDEPRTHERRVGVRLSLVPPFSGQAEADATLRVEVPEVRLHYRGHTRGAAGGDALRLSGGDLAAGREGLTFEATGLLGQPLRHDDIAVTTRGGLVNFPLVVDGERITVRPVSSWCTCLVWLVGAPAEVMLVYRGAEEARAAGPIDYAPTLSERLWSCGSIVSALAGLIWLLGAVAVFLRTPRFPKGSVAVVQRRNQPAPGLHPLNRWDASGNWRTIFGALLWRQWPARVSVEGLHFEATRGGPRLLLASTNGEAKIVSDGRTVRAIREENRAREFLPLSWAATFSERRSFERLSLRRS